MTYLAVDHEPELRMIDDVLQFLELVRYTSQIVEKTGNVTYDTMAVGIDCVNQMLWCKLLIVSLQFLLTHKDKI